MQENLISVLMPVKNGLPYLSACLDSICAQSETNWELVVVNDHSTDKTGEVLATYAEKDPRIRVFQNVGHGIIAALRLAYSHSKGEFISRMDADDLMSKNKLQLLKARLLEAGTGHLAIGLVSYFSEGNLGDGYQRYEAWLNQLTRTGNTFSEIYKECVVPSPCWMTYRTDLEACAAFQPDRYPEDYDLCFRFYEQQLTCLGVSEVLHFWRDYASRSSRTDPHYSDNRFLEIKLHYFLRLDYRAASNLVLWGAGKKAKQIAQDLLARNIPFRWICNNAKKIGKDIYGVLMEDVSSLKEIASPQVLIAVAGDEAQALIRSELNMLELKPMMDYYFFC